MLIRSSPVPVLDHKSLTCRQICRAALETAPSYGPVNTFSVTLTHSSVCVCVCFGLVLSKVFRFIEPTTTTPTTISTRTADDQNNVLG